MGRLPTDHRIKTECGMPNCRRTFKTASLAAKHVVSHAKLNSKGDDKHSLFHVSWTRKGLIRGSTSLG